MPSSTPTPEQSVAEAWSRHIETCPHTACGKAARAAWHAAGHPDNTNKATAQRAAQEAHRQHAH